MKDSRRPGAASPGMTQPLGPGLSAWPALSPDKHPVVNTHHHLGPPSAVRTMVYVNPVGLGFRAPMKRAPAGNIVALGSQSINSSTCEPICRRSVGECA